MATGAWAEDPIPDPNNSIVQWFQPVTGGVIFVCSAPGCTAGKTYLDVTLRDASGQPVPGQPATLTFADLRVCALPIVGITDAAGFVRLNLVAGANAGNGDQPRVSSDYTVTAGWTNVIIKTGITGVVSADLNCDLRVDAKDFSQWALGWLRTGSNRCADFNGDWVVDALDFSVFATHWLHQ
jgi:hypothetical protein